MTRDAEPTVAKSSQSVVGVSQRTAEHGNPNTDNDSKASSDKRAKKAEKFAALEKDFASKMRLKKTEFELKRKELEMEIQLFEEEGALKKEYKKEALDARASDSDESATPGIQIDHHSIGKPRRTKMFPVGSISRINSPTCTILVPRVRKPGSTTIIPG